MINFSSSPLAPSLNTSSSISLFISASTGTDLGVCLETIRGFLNRQNRFSAGEI